MTVENHIPAIIAASQLNDALHASRLSATELLSYSTEGYPELKFPAGYHLTCLHGRHRIQASREVLAQRNAWWAVDLYLAGMDNVLFHPTHSNVAFKIIVIRTGIVFSFPFSID
jgi:hypothetical protein